MAAAPAVTSVVNYADMREIGFPVSGAGANIPVGTIMMPGVTLGTNAGVLIPCTAASNADAIGILNEAHNYAASGDALTTTLAQWFPEAGFDSNNYLLGVKGSGGGPFPSHRVDLFDTAVLVKVSYWQGSTMAVASYSSPTVTITSEVTGKDSGFLYINAGTGIGQIGFITISNSGSDTLVSATPLTVALDSTSKLTQILPLFYNLPVWKINSTTVSTLLDSTAAAGTGRGDIIANFININGRVDRLDPKLYHNYQGLNSVSQLDFYSYIAMQDTGFHPID